MKNVYNNITEIKGNSERGVSQGIDSELTCSTYLYFDDAYINIDCSECPLYIPHGHCCGLNRALACWMNSSHGSLMTEIFRDE